MKIASLILFLVLSAGSLVWGQDQYSTGNITAQGTTCATTNACIKANLGRTVTSASVTLTGIFSATLVVEESADGGTTWTAVGTLSTPGATSYSTPAQTQIRVRCSAYTSGTVGVFIQIGTGSTSTNIAPSFVGQASQVSPTNVTLSSSAGASTTYSYGVIAVGPSGNSNYVISNTISTGAAFASLGANPNTLSCTAAPGAGSYIWFRLAPSANLGKIATTSTCALSDNGSVAGDFTRPWDNQYTNIGTYLSSFLNNVVYDGCLPVANPKYGNSAAGVQAAINDARSYAGQTGIVWFPQTTQCNGSTLGAISLSSGTITIPSGVCLVGMGPNASMFDSIGGVTAITFAAGAQNSCIMNMGIELDNTDTSGVGILMTSGANNRVINWSCYNNPTYGFPVGETCLSIQPTSNTSTLNNLFQNIYIHNVTVPILIGTVSGFADLADTFDNVMIGVDYNGTVRGWGANEALKVRSVNNVFNNINVHEATTGAGYIGLSVVSGRSNIISIFCDQTTSNICSADAGGGNEWHIGYTSGNSSLGTKVVQSSYQVNDFSTVTSSNWQSAQTAGLYNTFTNCAVNSVSPAACGAAASGAFVIPTTTTTYTVNTTAVTANSVIILTPRTYTGNLPSSPTCVVPTITAEPVVSAISAGTSFTLTETSTTGQTCWNYWIIN